MASWVLTAALLLAACERDRPAAAEQTAPATPAQASGASPRTPASVVPSPAASASALTPGSVVPSPAASASALTPGSVVPSPAASASEQAPAVSPSALVRPSMPSDDCHLAEGPLALSFTGPMALAFAPGAAPGERPRVIFNDRGAPRRATLGARALRTQVPPRPDGAAGQSPEPGVTASFPGCAILGDLAYCMDPTGAVRRWPLSGGAESGVVHARPGTPIAAASVGDGHAALAFLADLRTTEGVVMAAYVQVDDGPPQKLSEEGSGATFVALAPTGARVVAMYVDERRAMAPVHARVLALKGDGSLDLGRDAVIFVGDAAGARMTGALSTAPGAPSFALIASGRDAATFGMAAIRIDDPPQDDAPALWSMYPAALPPAPIAATRGTGPTRALRVRPSDKQASSLRALELGMIDAGGAYRASCVITEAKELADPVIEADARGALWIGYTTGGRSFLERRGREEAR